MAERHSEARPGMEWVVMDILDLKFGEEFDIVVDKGGSESRSGASREFRAVTRGLELRVVVVMLTDGRNHGVSPDD